MPSSVILASASEIRAQLLRNAGVDFDVIPARVDEDAIKAALDAEGARPRDVADTLAEFKARKLSEKNPGAIVMGCDQVLKLKGAVLSKAENPDQAREQLRALRGERHSLLSAVVSYRDGEPLWRFVGEARLTMHDFSDAFLENYLSRNWDSVRYSVGCYKLEEEGVRLFQRVEGDYFTILGLPLLEVLAHLSAQGVLQE
ncbi:septum formation protein Maf [Actibacterium mucosum KCTC 23349]|uniref:Nucleoside triphosphate pyrophosphatase n=1 Tax=Actibacterium mucosum KCTC 23349 TaxID=1454373 RepID=A0A037ZLB3_9RHOB|nr:Maf family protein [Actibacterium mucosum]KAJ57246.1 septum formation protein Maf [Actibacterium mucosum KCTC 23349]